MYFNEFASGTDARDLTQTEELTRLIEDATQLNIPFKKPSRYVSRNVVVNGVRLHLLEWGQASLPTVLLMHGNGLSAHTWDFTSLALSDRYHVLALDQRGHGDSEWPRDWDLSLASMVEDVAEIIRSLPQKPIVIGHSMSGRVSMELLSREDMASKLVIVDIAPEMPEQASIAEMTPEAAEEAARRSLIDQQPWQWESVDAYIQSIVTTGSSRSPEMIQRTMGYNLLQRSDGMIVSKVLRRSAAGIMRRPLGGPTLRDLRQIRCPTLVIRGEHSPQVSPEAALAMHAALTNGQLITVPNAGHNVHTQNALGFLAAIEPFLAE